MPKGRTEWELGHTEKPGAGAVRDGIFPQIAMCLSYMVKVGAIRIFSAVLYTFAACDEKR